MKRRHGALALMIAGALAAPGCALLFGIEEVSEGTGGTQVDGGPDAPDASDASDADDTSDASDAGDASDASDADDTSDASDGSDASDSGPPNPCEWPSTEDWTRSFAAADVSVAGVAVDSQGHVIVAGTVAGDLDIGGQILPGGADRDVFVFALDEHGQHLWSRRFGDVGDQRALGLALDPPTSPTPDAILVTGSVAGTLDFGGSSSSLSGDKARAFVARLDPTTGDGIAALAAGGKPSKAHTGTAVVALTDGSLFWAGTQDDGEHLFVRKLDPGFAVTATTAPACAGCDAHLARIPGGVAVAGGFLGQLDLVTGGIGPLTSAGGADVFMGLVSVPGSLFQEDQVSAFGGLTTEVGTGIGGDGAGATYVVGNFEGNLDWKNGVELTSTGSLDTFVARVSGALEGQWAKGFGSANVTFDQRAAAVAVGNRVAVVGDFFGEIDFGLGAPVVSAGSLDGYAAALDPATGTVTQAYRFGSPAFDGATAVAADQSSHIFVGGVLGAPATLACGPVGGPGKAIFVARRTVP